MSIAGGTDRALERGASIGCSAVQIFLKNNMQWRAKPIAPEEAQRFHARRGETGIAPVFAHSSYLINLAATNPQVRRPSIIALADELRRAALLDVPFIVMHPGAHMGAGEEAGLRQVALGLDEAFAESGNGTVRIALETTAGQGTNLGWRFAHLARIFELVGNSERLGVCIDTCHLFAAGYDIRTEEGYQATMDELERAVPARHVVAFHLNDSKTPLGSRVDRHEHVGRGQIGLTGFRRVLQDPRWRDLPMVLETPKGEDLREDVENLRVLRGLVATS
jgi:deoxyribonuclease IV